MNRYIISPLDDARGQWKRRCCVWKEQPPVGAVVGHVAERSGAVFISDPARSVDEKEITERQKGWGCTTRSSFPGGNSRLSTPRSMERRFLCGINRVVADVDGQWLYKSEPLTGFSLLFSAHAHICNDTERGLENSRRGGAPFRIPGSQSCRQNATERLGYGR